MTHDTRRCLRLLMKINRYLTQATDRVASDYSSVIRARAASRVLLSHSFKIFLIIISLIVLLIYLTDFPMLCLTGKFFTALTLTFNP